MYVEYLLSGPWMHIFFYTCTAKLELIRKFLLIDLNNAIPIIRDSSFIKHLKSMCVIILVFSNIKILFPYILLFQEKISYLVLLTETLKGNQAYNVLLVRRITAVFFNCWGIILYMFIKSLLMMPFKS